MPSTDARVHVVCAPPNGPNPGMAAVDLALDALARRAGLTGVRYWRLWDASEWREAPGGSTRLDEHRVRDDQSGLVYELGRDRFEELLDADRVVYWGDFLHMAVYLEQVAHVWTHRIGLPLTPEHARALASRTLLLDGERDAVLARTVSYGSTLAFNTAADYAGPYGEALARFHAGVARVSHRDSYSAEVARRHRADDASCKGLDAAFLLPTVASEPSVLRRNPERGGSLGVFVGRSQLSPEDVGTFGRRLAAGLGLAPTWLPWGREPGFWPMEGRRRLRAVWPELTTGSPTLPAWSRARATAGVARLPRPVPVDLPFAELERRVGACSVVLTDTYHLAVTAWRLGVPAVCVVDPPTSAWNVNAGSTDAGRDKRVDLYSQLDALALLVHADDGSLRSREQVRRLVDVLGAGTVAGATAAHLADQRARETERVLRMLEAA